MFLINNCLWQTATSIVISLPERSNGIPLENIYYSEQKASLVHKSYAEGVDEWFA